jgi:hypothetical protein
MKTSYAVVWRDETGAARTGRLEFSATSMRLVAGAHVFEISGPDLVDVAVARDDSSRFEARRIVVLELRDGSRVSIAPLAQVGLVGELARARSSLSVRLKMSVRSRKSA